jgi:hypothetical protein
MPSEPEIFPRVAAELRCEAEARAIERAKTMIFPTATGVLKYPPDGYYEGEPCTCTEKCLQDCNGTVCECSACWSAYCDAMEWD